MKHIVSDDEFSRLKSDSAVYTDVDIEMVESGSKGTLSISTNRLQAILPYKMASAKVPYNKS